MMMIPHPTTRGDCVAELALSRARRLEVKALAQRIIASQSREFTQIAQWYRQWNGTSCR